MARQKFGEYVLDLRGLPTTTFNGSPIDISDFLTNEQKVILSGDLRYQKNIYVILPQLDYDDGNIEYLSFGDEKFTPVSVTKYYLTIIKGQATDENNVEIGINLYISTLNGYTLNCEINEI